MANLYIGLGGAGVKTLAHLKYSLFTGNKELYEKSRFLFIDTDEGDIRISNSRYEGILDGDFISRFEILDLGNVNVFRYYEEVSRKRTERGLIHDPAKLRFLEWFDKRAIATISDGVLKWGASANRQAGRAALAVNYEACERVLENTISSLMTKDDLDNKSLHIYTVCSVAGGTGSAIYLDLMFLIEHLTKDRFGYLGPYIISIFYMPEIFRKMQQGVESIRDATSINAYAFWKEMNAFLKHYYINVKQLTDENGKPIFENGIAKYNEHADINYNVFNSFAVSDLDDKFRWKPFNMAVLVDFHISTNREFTSGELFVTTADLVKRLSDDKINSNLLSYIDISLNRITSKSIDNKWIDAFSVAGFRALEGPNNYLRQYFKARLSRDVYKSLVYIDEKDKTKNSKEKDVLDFLNKRIFPFTEDNSGIISGCSSKPDDNGLYMKMRSVADEFVAQIDKKIKQAGEDKEALKTAANDIFKLYSNQSDNIVSEFKKSIDNKSVVDRFINSFSEHSEEIVQRSGVGYLHEFILFLDNEITRYYWLHKSSLDSLSTVESGLGCTNGGLIDLIRKTNNEIQEAKTIAVLGKSAEYFQSKITSLKKVIEAWANYQLQEVLTKVRMEIYNELSVGENAVTDKISVKCGDLLKNLKKKYAGSEKYYSTTLPAEFSEVQKRVTHMVIPSFSEIVFNNQWKSAKEGNIFEGFYTNNSVVAHSKDEPIRSKQDDMHTLQDILGEINSNYPELTLTNTLKIHNSVIIPTAIKKFDQIFNTYIEKIFFQMESISDLFNKPLAKWCEEYPSDFHELRENFENETPLFFPEVISDNYKYELWLAPSKDTCDLITENSDNKHIIQTNEDIVVNFKYSQGVNFSQYNQFEKYECAYNDRKQNKPEAFYPHIHKDFNNNDDLMALFLEKESSRTKETKKVYLERLKQQELKLNEKISSLADELENEEKSI